MAVSWGVAGGSWAAISVGRGEGGEGQSSDVLHFRVVLFQDPSRAPHAGHDTNCRIGYYLNKEKSPEQR